VAAYPGDGSSGNFNLKPWWEVQEVSLRVPGSDTVFNASELVKTGKYIVEVKLGGEHYATYEYMAAGTIPHNGRQNRENTDPKQLLEGVNDRFYIKRIE